MALLSMAWTAAKGAAKFAAAVASGDVACDEDVAYRRGVCRACPSRERVQVPGASEPSDWCGPPLEDRTNVPLTIEGKEVPTCGCLLAGKTMVASEYCPQGLWGSVPGKAG